MAVAEYTFHLIRGGPDVAWSRTLSFEADGYAIAEAKRMLEHEATAGRGDAASVCVGRGFDETEIEWLGSWDHVDGGTVRWSPDE